MERTLDDSYSPKELRGNRKHRRRVCSALLGHKSPRYPTCVLLQPFAPSTVARISHRVSRVMFGGDRIAVLKIAPFQFEVSSLQRELSIYAKLMSSGFAFAPKSLGYVYEEVEDRTIGLLMEDISGRTPGIGDLEACEKTVRLFHEQGIVHGDLNKYNMLVSNNGVVIFDFGVSTIREDEESLEAQEELRSLAERLLDDSGIGKYE